MKDKVFQAVVYDNFSGCPIVVAFLGNRWWVVTPGEKVQPLEEYFPISDQQQFFQIILPLFPSCICIPGDPSHSCKESPSGRMPGICFLSFPDRRPGEYTV